MIATIGGRCVKLNIAGCSQPISKLGMSIQKHGCKAGSHLPIQSGKATSIPQAEALIRAANILHHG
jgi:hypothetical protein